MAPETLEAKAHKLIAQLDSGKLAAVVHLLEVLVEHEEPVTEEDRRRFHQGEVFFAGGKGIPMEEVLGEHGLTPDDFALNK